MTDTSLRKACWNTTISPTLKPWYANARQWLLPEYVVKAGRRRTDKDIWKTLIQIDEDIIQGRRAIDFFIHNHGAAASANVQQMRDWVANQQKNNRSIYWCYGKSGP